MLHMILLCLFNLNLLFAADDDVNHLKNVMHTFESEISKIHPFLTSDEKFKDKKNSNKIRLALKNLDKKLSEVPPKVIEDNIGFNINYNLLVNHIKETNRVYKNNEFEYARVMLNATTNFCTSCHTQNPARKTSKEQFIYLENELKNVSLSNAEFLFITRRFDEALAQYNNLVQNYPKSKIKADDLSNIYKRKLAVFARIQRDPAAAVANLNEDLKNKEIPKDIQENIKTWITFFENWKNEKESPNLSSSDKLLEYVKKNIPDDQDRKIAPADPNIVNYLKLSGLLYEKLMKEPDSDNSQGMLYYLALSERHLSPLYWYSLSDLYLTECITRFPKQSYSNKCYDMYKKVMENRYLLKGPLPDNIKRTLENYKKYL